MNPFTFLLSVQESTYYPTLLDLNFNPTFHRTQTPWPCPHELIFIIFGTAQLIFIPKLLLKFQGSTFNLWWTMAATGRCTDILFYYIDINKQLMTFRTHHITSLMLNIRSYILCKRADRTVQFDRHTHLPSTGIYNTAPSCLVCGKQQSTPKLHVSSHTSVSHDIKWCKRERKKQQQWTLWPLQCDIVLSGESY
jgi:hypothetical protein